MNVYASGDYDVIMWWRSGNKQILMMKDEHDYVDWLKLTDSLNFVLCRGNFSPQQSELTWNVSKINRERCASKMDVIVHSLYYRTLLIKPHTISYIYLQRQDHCGCYSKIEIGYSRHNGTYKNNLWFVSAVYLKLILWRYISWRRRWHGGEPITWLLLLFMNSQYWDTRALVIIYDEFDVIMLYK